MRPKKQRIFMSIMAGLLVVMMILPLIASVLVR